MPTDATASPKFCDIVKASLFGHNHTMLHQSLCALIIIKINDNCTTLRYYHNICYVWYVT